MIINIKVKTGSEKQEIVRDGKGYLIYLKSRPVNNEANIELLKLLKKYFKKEARIKSGLRSRTKIVEVIGENKIT